MIRLAAPLAIIALAAQQLRPPPALTVSEWADTYRVLSREDSAAPGRWNTSARPYQRGIMDALADPRVDTVVVMGPSQWGKSQVALNFLGRSIHLDPGPLMFVGPTVDAVKRFSKTRLASMIRDCPELAALVSDEKSRDSSNTILEKTFPGGSLLMVGSNAPAGLASQPIRDLVLDELDRFGVEAGEEGAPEDLAEARTLDFEGRRKIYINSTPTLEGASRIETRYLQSDQRVYEVPCPHCWVPQTLDWERVRWEAGVPATARYHCISERCSKPWTQRQIRAQAQRGAWVITNPVVKAVAGFKVHGLLARSMEIMVRRYEEARARGPENIKTWWNTVLGLPFNPRDLERLQAEGLMARRKEWKAEVPWGVGILTASVDVQDDRLEWLVWGWGTEGRSWGHVDRGVVAGNTQLADTWNRLGDTLRRTWRHAAGVDMDLSAICVDTGYLPKMGIAFCKAMSRGGWRAFPVKGASKSLNRLVQHSSKQSLLWSVDTVAVKDIIFGRLAVAEEGPGYISWPMTADKDFFQQLLSEHVTRKRVKGVTVRVYEKVISTARNEGLDLAVYNLAAFELLNIKDMDARLRALELAAQPPEEKPKPVTPKRERPTLPPSPRLPAFMQRRKGPW